jgi:hypothetical protein
MSGLPMSSNAALYSRDILNARHFVRQQPWYQLQSKDQVRPIETATLHRWYLRRERRMHQSRLLHGSNCNRTDLHNQI